MAGGGVECRMVVEKRAVDDQQNDSDLVASGSVLPRARV